MDESWRMSMGSTPMSSLPRRRSTEQYSSNRSSPVFADSETLEPEDFADVFGGPPRSVFWRKMSAGDASSNSFYEEIFRPPEILHSAGEIGGRGLPAFRIPRTSDRFYSDVFRFGSDFSAAADERRSRDRSRPNSKAKSKSKSKSTSSSVLSSEEMSPLRPVIAEHVALSDFASKLRPLNVPCRKNHSSTTMHSNETLSRKQCIPTLYGNRPSYAEHHHFIETENNWNFGRSHFSFSRRVSSPETISIEPDSYPSVKISVEDDVELNSPASPVSSLCHGSNDDHAKSENHGDHVVEEEEEEALDQEQEEDDDDDDDDDEVMSSYVIEISSDHREGTCDAAGIDEAIAWAKEKFQTHSSEKNLNTGEEDIKESPKKDAGKPNARDFPEQQMKNHGVVQSPEMEMRLHDEDIRLWSAGKETDIRLLLSTLHYILWPNSGWSAIPLTSLIESTNVKKAYQKARLCLHPDKLQQRGATLAQKYVADKAFPILQDAWASFISQDVSFTG